MTGRRKLPPRLQGLGAIKDAIDEEPERIWHVANACPDRHRHTTSPDGVVEWRTWAERKYRTHYQIKCPSCGLFAIWKRRDKPLTKAQVDADLYSNSEPAQ